MCLAFVISFHWLAECLLVIQHTTKVKLKSMHKFNRELNFFFNLSLVLENELGV